MTADKVENSGSPAVIDRRYSEQFEFFPQACYGQPGARYDRIYNECVHVGGLEFPFSGRTEGEYTVPKIPEADNFATGGDMSERATRREFLKLAGAGGAAMGLGGW